MPTILQTDELNYLLALKLLNGVGDVRAFKLLQQFHSAPAIFLASAHQLQQAGLKNPLIEQIVSFDFSRVQPILDWAKQLNRHIIPWNSSFYPPLLSQINSPPLLLFAIGNPEILLSPQIAVVGARSPSAQGLSNAKDLSQAIAQQGLTVTSGLALGIDGQAHRAALNASGYTIAVLGTGVNRVSPSIHRELAHQIAHTGVLVSEKLPDEGYDGGSFPQRNRIIAGMSLGTLVIEAAHKSGSLITARHAMEEGREVYAVPGSIHNPLSKGCHRLIKQGAKLVESIEDIIEDLPCIAKGQIDHSQQPERPALTAEDANFLKFIDYEITPLDLIVSRSQLTVEAVSNKLLLLELEGWVINSAGGFIRQ